MWELDHKEGWVLKNWCFWTVVLEKIFESPLDSKEIQPVNPKGNQSIITGKIDAKAEAPILWPPDGKSWLIRKDPDAGDDWRQEEKEVTEDEMVGWNHWLNGHESEQTLGYGEREGSLTCCCSWVCKESQKVKWLSDWTTNALQYAHHQNGVSFCHCTVDLTYPFCPPPGLFLFSNHYSVLCILCVCFCSCFFWLWWVFAARGLSLAAASRDYSLLCCTGFPLRCLLLLQSIGSKHTGFSGFGLWALKQSFGSCGACASLLHSMWDLPGPGTEPASLVLQADS